MKSKISNKNITKEKLSMNDIYSEEFYKKRHNKTLHAAQRILNIVLSTIYPHKISSVVDLGCGVGTWCSFLKDKGIDVTGIDGLWVPQKYLVIPENNFIAIDISEELCNRGSSLWKLPTYDLSISLEVAEHINEEYADSFVEFLTSHSDYVLFSAAIPGQTGDGHVNEQWPSYWSEKFSRYGFDLYDIIRHEIWDDKKIPFWYRQNCFLGVRSGEIKLKDSFRVEGEKFNLVHPEQFRFIRYLYEETNSLKYIWNRIKSKIKFRT